MPTTQTYLTALDNQDDDMTEPETKVEQPIMSQALVPYQSPPKKKQPVDETQAKYRSERLRREQKKSEELYRQQIK